MASDCSCFFCNTECEVHELPSRSYTSRYSCRYCGEYLLDPEDRRRLSDAPDDRFKIACVLNERRLKDLPGIALSDKTDIEDTVFGLPQISIEDIIGDFPTKASQILNRSLLNMSRLPERPYDAIRRDFTEMGNCLMLFTADQQSSYAFLNELASQGYIRFNRVEAGLQSNVFFRTTMFWDKVEDIVKEDTNHQHATTMEDTSMSSELPLIFISYARPDLVAAQAVVELLRSAGFPTWFDKKDLKGGQDWEFEIRKHIGAASLVLVCLSTNAVDRKGFFHKEMRYALDEALKLTKGKVFIVPVCFNECEIPDDLRKWHVIKLFEPSASWKLLGSIGDALDYGARVRMEAHKNFESAMRKINM